MPELPRLPYYFKNQSDKRFQNLGAVEVHSHNLQPPPSLYVGLLAGKCDFSFS